MTPEEYAIETVPVAYGISGWNVRISERWSVSGGENREFVEYVAAPLRAAIAAAIRKAIAAEREACAKVAEFQGSQKWEGDPTDPVEEEIAQRIAREIRARSNP